jgi:acetyl-CoA decarbonylase/synthase complex subunit alpha
VEYRDAAFSVWAACPGFITLTGCAATPNAVEEIAWMAEEFASIGFIVYLSGCAAIAAGQVKDSQGKTVYERHYGTFQVRGVVNTGECSTNCHCLGGDTKLSVIAGRVPYRANYIEIADYLLNRWGSTVVIWGATSEKLYAMASGWARIGIPAIIGPASQGLMDRFFLGDGKDSSHWWLYDILRGKKIYVEPGKNHLITPVSTKEEAINMAAKLMMSPCDITPARETRIMHYVDTYRPLENGLPEDWHHFCRGITELPTRLKFKLLRDLARKGWDVNVKKGKILRFRRPDGEMVDDKEFFERHRIPHGVSGARVPKLILKEQTRFSEDGSFA